LSHRISTRALTSVLASVLSLLGPIGASAQQAAHEQGGTPAIAASPPLTEHPDETPFLAENNAAMDKMMSEMAVKPTGDVDADFAAMMIPHHQGAIDMALAELRYGRNEQLRRIAQEIVVEQQQEIIAMRLALGQPLPPPAVSPTQGSPSQPVAVPTHDHSSMHGAMSMSPSTKMK
jgi:hypothetical protein